MHELHSLPETERKPTTTNERDGKNIIFYTSMVSAVFWSQIKNKNTDYTQGHCKV